MKSKSIFSIILVIALLTVSLFAAGCAERPTEEEITPTPTPTATEILTPEPTEEPTEQVTVEPELVSIRIRNYNFLGGDRQINTGNTVKWLNDEVSSYQTRCVVSEDSIWEDDQCLSYRKSVTYTFDKPGVYSFYLKGREELTKLQITVV